MIVITTACQLHSVVAGFIIWKLMEARNSMSLEIGILELSYLIASIAFIIGLKRLSHPEKARSGNILASVGMGLAIVCTIVFHDSVGIENKNLWLIIGAIVVGLIAGWYIAMKAAMTDMPQLVSFALAPACLFAAFAPASFFSIWP